MFLATNIEFLSAVNYLFYFILGLAILMGFIRGFKKSIFNLIIMLIFYALFFITINQAVEFLWTFEMPWLGSILGNVDPSFSNFTSFEGSLDTFIQFILGDSTIDLTTSSAEVVALATGLLKFVLKIVWTIAYFTVILLLYKFIMWIIASIFLKTKKGASKNRGLGAVMGVLNGVLAVFVLVIMLGGIMSVAESTVSLLNDNETPQLAQIQEYNQTNTFDGRISVIQMAEEDVISQDLLDQMNDIIDGYNNNIFVKLFSNIKTQSTLNSEIEVPLHIDLFDRVLSFEYDENLIGIRYELSVFSQAANVLLESDYYSTKEITDITGDEIRDIFTNLSNSVLITSLMPAAIEVASQMFEVDLSIDKEDLYAIDYETELANLGNIAGALFDIINGAGFIGGTGSVDQITIDGDAVRDVFSDVSGSDIIILITESILLPMLSEPGQSIMIDVPDDLDIEAEYLALGEIFAQIIEADLSFSDFENADVSVLLSAVSKIDLLILKDSKIVSSALVNILSGQMQIEGLDVLEIPSGIVWEDDGAVEGELTKILRALNVLTEVISDFDFANLDVTLLTELNSTQVDTIFDSYVLRATVSEMIKTTELGDMPLILPDTIYDSQGYFTKTELVNVVSAVTLVLGNTGTDFDVMKVLDLTETEIQTLLDSDIIHATVGDMLYDYGSTSLVIPNSVTETITVDSVNQTIVNKTEIKEILQALSVLEITDFDTMSFDAGIINTLENTAQDDLDDTKIQELLDSGIIHATVSDMIVDLSSTSGGVLEIPNLDVLGNQLLYTTAGLEYISKTEITNILKALYSIDITDFSSMNFEDTTLLLNNLDNLLVSSILQATVSKQITDLSGTFLEIPEQDVLGNPIKIVQGTTLYIDADELSNLIAVVSMLGLSDPTQLTNTFTLSNFTDPADQTTLLASAIMHATISKTIMDIGSTILVVPNVEEDDTPVKIQTGPVGLETTYIAAQEIKDIINALDAMGFADLNSFSGSINTSLFLNNSAIMLESASLQATISDMILSSDTVDNVNPTLRIPDQQPDLTPIRIAKADITYISKAELTRFIASLNELGLSDFDTFGFEADDIFGIADKNTFFASYIMQATASKYILDVAGDETAPAGTTSLLVPSTRRENITIDSVNFTQIEKTELISIFNGLQIMGMNNFSDSVSTTSISSLTEANMYSVLDSASFHITIDNMVRSNPNINTKIPSLAETTDYGLVQNILTKTEIVEFVQASNALGSGAFTTNSFSYLAIASLSEAQRDEVLDSMIVRNILTDELETMMTGDPDPYWPANTFYENNDPLEFLTEAGINDVFTHYGLI